MKENAKRRGGKFNTALVEESRLGSLVKKERSTSNLANLLTKVVIIKMFK